MTPPTIDIRCCDCVELLRSLPDKSIDLIVTDPPYQFAQTTGGGAFGSAHKQYHEEYGKINGGIPSYILDECVRVMKKINMYVWGNWKLIAEIMAYFQDKEVTTNLLSWHKTNPVPMCNNKYLNDTEYCLFIRGKGVKVNGGYEDSKTYWISPSNATDKKKFNHPTIKPESIIEQLIRNSSGGGGYRA